MKTSKADSVVLKRQILEPGYPDREGMTSLDKRADNNRKLASDSEERKRELNIALGLLDDLSDFKSQDISLLISFMKRSDFSETVMFKKFLEVLKKNDAKMNTYKKAELVRMALEIMPDKVPVDLIQVGLAQLKTAEPWLYAEILTKLSPYKALDFVIHLLLIDSHSYASSSFVHLMLQWMEIPDRKFIEQMSKKLINLIPVRDKEALELFKYKLEEKGIKIKEEGESFNAPASLVDRKLTSADAFKQLAERRKENLGMQT